MKPSKKSAAKQYYGIFNMKKTFQPGKDKVYYAQASYGKEEINAVVKCLEEGWLGMGKYVAEFEQKVSGIFGHTHGLVVNSGSSADYLAFKVLGLPEGSEVITPACTFPTTYSAILLAGCMPVVGDSEIGSYNLDLKNLEKMLSPKTRAVMIPHTLGNLNDMEVLSAFCKKHNLYLVEDSCDTIGGTFNGKPTGAYSDMTTSSFYASHITTAGGGGGILCMSKPEFWRTAYAFREWGRAALDNNEDISERFTTELTGISYDRKFTYTHMGHNLKPVEMMFAFGLVQLKKLNKFIGMRRAVFDGLYNFFSGYEDYFILPKEHPKAKVAWLAFPLTLKDNVPFTRLELVSYLEAANIQTRLLFAGNILRQPGYKDTPRRIVGTLANADKIMRDSFVIGAHQCITPKMLSYVKATFKKFLDSKKPGKVR
ncbi:MAG: DegT/DnrJ/EryC1/StrS family aminotransferase [bacterium]|nr:DegT/DnrJ/EryC1/StrS family aminotransferase [bacterium]